MNEQKLTLKEQEAAELILDMIFNDYFALLSEAIRDESDPNEMTQEQLENGALVLVKIAKNSGIDISMYLEKRDW